MLTSDQKEMVLALRAKSFSYDRIARELDLSPTTVRKVILHAGEHVQETAAASLAAVAETPNGSSLLDQYEQLKASQALEDKKTGLRERIEIHLAALSEARQETVQEGLADEEWPCLLDKLEERLSWIHNKLASVSGTHETEALEGLLVQAESEVVASTVSSMARVHEIRRQRESRMVASSRRLLDKYVGSGQWPSAVVTTLKQCLLVQNEAEAEQVQCALHEFEFYLPLDRPARPQAWGPFLRRLKAEGWKYVGQLCQSFEDRNTNFQRQMYGELLMCPRCYVQIRVAPGSLGWFKCPRCASPIWKGGPGPPAVPPRSI